MCYLWEGSFCSASVHIWKVNRNVQEGGSGNPLIESQDGLGSSCLWKQTGSIITLKQGCPLTQRMSLEQQQHVCACVCVNFQTSHLALIVAYKWARSAEVSWSHARSCCPSFPLCRTPSSSRCKHAELHMLQSLSYACLFVRSSKIQCQVFSPKLSSVIDPAAY